MGSSLGNVKVALQPVANANLKSAQWKRGAIKQKEVDINVIEVANIALAIKHKEHIVNVELIVLGCNNLPSTKAFEDVHTMVALFKLSQGEQIEIGRTNIVSNDLNPRFLSTFIVSSSSDKQEEIEFRIFNFSDPNSEHLENQTLIGTVRSSLDQMIVTEFNPLPVLLSDSNCKEKTMLKVHCSDYDGANVKYEIQIEAANFVGRLQLYYLIEVVRDGELIPVAKSNTIQIKKKTEFDQLKVATSKFPGEDAARLRIRLFDVAKTEQEVGCTDELTLYSLVNQQQKSLNQRVYKNGFVVGNIIVSRWHKVNRDSFLTYIVNGARLHLILGIDFTNSNFQSSQPLHHSDDDKNMYITAIREIVSLLQYFNYYNQIALYGFGAKLPPYYKCVGQCFALNGNYFHPLITGGVDQIIHLYKDNLAKIQPHGPSKLSEIINMAIQFSQAQYQSSNYYVLIILTDGQIDDYQDTVDKIIEASELPLSIFMVGLGNGDFSQIQSLDQDKQAVRSQRTGKTCERDMIGFISLNQLLKDKSSPQAETKLALITFAEIPNQFVDYMQRKNIKPNKEKKGLKAAKSQFISEKIKQYKKNTNEMPVIPEVQFLKEQKKKMRRQLLALGLGLDSSDELEKNLNIPMNSLNYFIQILSAQKQRFKQQQQDLEAETVNYKQEKKFQEHLQKNQEFINKRNQNELLKREINQMGKKKRVASKPLELVRKDKKHLQHPCLQCRQREIVMLHMSCGHLAVCQVCCSKMCFLCKQISDQLKDVRDYRP